MSRKVRVRNAARPALLGDREHTRRVAGRTGIATFIMALMILFPLAYGLVRARSLRLDPMGSLDIILIGVMVIASASAMAFAANVIVHLLGREARARRSR